MRSVMQKLRKGSGVFIVSLFILLLVLIAPVKADYPVMYVCGDVNGDGAVNIADVSRIIYVVFFGQTYAVPAPVGDANGDGVTNVADASYIITMIFFEGPDPQCLPFGELPEAPACNAGSESPEMDGNLDCLRFSYDGESFLQMQHVNAGLNCCPDPWNPVITVTDDQIIIDETGIDGLCDCECLFDLDLYLHFVEPGTYEVIVLEPLMHPEEDSLIFTINLEEQTNGEYCVTRSYYPWYAPGSVSGSVIETAGCKTFDADKDAGAATSDQDCLEYVYDGSGTLDVTHINGGFNCCPDYITGSYELVNDTIYIHEEEWFISGGCYCLCLFDVQHRITGIVPGDYVICIDGLYIDEEDDPLAVAVTLEAGGSSGGPECVTRDYYPWGTEVITGSVVGNSGCKTYDVDKDAETITNGQDCLEFEYDGLGTLDVNNINGGFICCPGEIIATYDLVNDTIYIYEDETLEGGGCSCLCLFDVQHQITGIVPGDYVIRIEGLYTEDNGDPLTVEVSLTAEGSSGGPECVDRDHYPWNQY